MTRLSSRKRFMKAIVWTKYGPPEGLQLREVAKPVSRDNEVLIKVRASTVTAGDSELRRIKFPFLFGLAMRLFIGVRRPKRVIILGQELAGEIEAAGRKVTRFKTGDQVFGHTGFGFGANAEYKCLPETATLALKPANMTFEEAAAVPTGGLEALYFLRKANIKPRERALIYGASGSIGTFAVQLAKHFGAWVTAVGGPGSLELLKSLGADEVIDYTREDFSRSGQAYDVIFDAVGKSSFSRSVGALQPKGRFLLTNPWLWTVARALWVTATSRKKVVLGASSGRSEDLHFLKGLIEAGKLRAIIDRRYPLERTGEAHRYVDTGQKIGNVAITTEVDH
jgi:NADPH:quinone reductase-like Zn-dependent oxidoreductase